MDLGQPLDLMSMILTPLQPGPPPAAAADFEDTLAALMSGAPAPALSGAPPAPKAEGQPWDTSDAPLPSPMVAPPLRVDAAPLPMGPPLESAALPPTDAPVPDRATPAPADDAPELTWVAGPLVHQALRLPPSALIVASPGGSPSPMPPAAALPHAPAPRTPDWIAAERPGQAPEPLAELTEPAPLPHPAKAEPPPGTEAAAAPKALQRMAQGLGVRVLQQRAGRPEHPLMQLEKAAGARWTQLAQQTAPAQIQTPATPLDWAPALSQALAAEGEEPQQGLQEGPALQGAGFAEMPRQGDPSPAPTQTSTALPVPQSTEAPEEWVPAPRFLEVEIDPELTLSLSASGRELDLSLSGSAEALAPLGEMEGELREGLERSGWQLRDFTTQERGGERRRHQAPTPRSQAGTEGRPQSAPARGPLPRGEHINRVA